MQRIGALLIAAFVVALGVIGAATARPAHEPPAQLAGPVLPRYIVQFLPSPVPDDPLKPRGINQRGDMTGFVNWPYDAWVNRYGSGTTELLPDLAGKTHSVGWAINEARDVAGSSGFETIEPPERAVRWRAGAPQNLGTIGTDSRAYGLNNQGDVVGMAYVGGNSHAFYWNETSGMIDLTPDIGFSTAYDVNDQAQVTGSLGNGRAFRWQAGVRQQLDPPAGYAYSSGMAINEEGQVAGQVKTASGNSAKFARWSPGIGWEILGGSGQNNMLWGLNDQGDAVGIGNSGGFQVGFVYLEGLGLHRIDNLLLVPDQWLVLGAYDINNKGLIAAYVSATDGSGRMGAARLIPTTTGVPNS